MMKNVKATTDSKFVCYLRLYSERVDEGFISLDPAYDAQHRIMLQVADMIDTHSVGIP